MEFRILGPIEVTHGSRPVPVGGGRERAVLALLLLSPNRVVSSARLGDLLWDAQPPDNVGRAVRVYVSRLRRAFRDAGAEDVLVTQSSGYRLCVAAEGLDADRFEALLAQGRAEASAAEHNLAATTLRDALALWRGAALADVADVPPVRTEAARLEELRLAALEGRIEADLACGRHAELVAELDGLTRMHPLRERLWEHRLLALYRAGRQGEALRAYQDLRRILGEELGIEPGAELRHLETAILRQEARLDWRRPEGGTTPEPSGPAPSAATTPMLPLPTFVHGAGWQFVGREDELAHLERARAAAAAGRRQVVLVSGEPGVGKTRLVAELARAAHEQGTIVLGGRCDEDLAVPYQPFLEALRHVITYSPGDDLAAQIGHYGGDLVRLVPELAERVGGLPSAPPADFETERYRLFEAVAGWLVAVAARRPVVFMVDDLHWAAKPTVLLLRHVIRHHRPMRLLIIATYRDTDLDPGHPLTALLADLRRDAGVVRLALSGLAEAEVAAFVEAAVGHSLSEAEQALVQAIHIETAGNAFFVGEVVRLLTDSGTVHAPPTADSLALSALGVPDGVREVVTRRLRRLSETANLALQLGAVAGAEFDLPLLAAAGPFDEDALVEALEEAVAARLLVDVSEPEPLYRFAHALTRAALYGGLSVPRRRRLHRRLGEALEQLAGRGDPPRLTELAHHFVAAADGPGDERAIRYTVQAAEATTKVLAHEQTAALYERAVGLLPSTGPDSGSQRLDLLLRTGDAYRRAGDTGQARRVFLEAFRLADTIDDPERLAQAALGVGDSAPVFDLDEELVGLLRAALDRLGEGHHPLTARLLGRLAQALYYSAEPAERSELSARAVEQARRSGDTPALASVLCARHAALWGPDDVEERLEVANEVLRLAHETGSAELELQGNAWRLVDLLELGDGPGAEAATAAHACLAARLNEPRHRRDAVAWRTMWAMLAGRFDDAEQGIEEVFRLSHRADDPDATIGWCQRWWLISERGDPGEMAAITPRLAELTARQGASRPAWLAGVALHHARLGSADTAQALVNEVVERDLNALPRNAVWLNTLTHLAEAVALLGDSRTAAALYEALLPYRDRMALLDRAIVCKGAVAYYLGLLARAQGDTATALAHFDAARDAYRRIAAPPLVARTEREYARAAAAISPQG